MNNLNNYKSKLMRLVISDALFIFFVILAHLVINLKILILISGFIVIILNLIYIYPIQQARALSANGDDANSRSGSKLILSPLFYLVGCLCGAILIVRGDLSMAISPFLLVMFIVAVYQFKTIHSKRKRD